MEETKTLALLLVAAIIVSLGGTIVSLNKLGELGLSSITGKASDPDQGIVTLNITSETNIAVTKNIDFGNGYVNASCTNCTMWTNTSTGGTSTSDQSCCEGDWANIASSNYAQAGMWIENQGNTNLTLKLNFSKTATSFLGASAEAQFLLMVDNDAKNCAGTCTNVNSDDGTDSCPGLTNTTWTHFVTEEQTVCPSYTFTYDNTKDEIVLDSRVLVPGSAIAETKSVTLTFTGESQ